MKLFKRKKNKKVDIQLGIFSKKRDLKLSRFINRDKALTDPVYFADRENVVFMLLPNDIIKKLPVAYLEEVTGSRRPEKELELFLWEVDAEMIIRRRTARELMCKYLKIID